MLLCPDDGMVDLAVSKTAAARRAGSSPALGTTMKTKRIRYPEISDDQIREAIQNSNTMSEAARLLGIEFRGFRQRADALGLYAPNRGGKGSDLPKRDMSVYSLEDIFANKVPFQSYKLKLRLYREGLKKNVCEICGVFEWNGKPLNCQLDHIDGNKNNNALENLRIICPNCHSQTETFGFKNGRQYWLN